MKTIERPRCPAETYRRPPRPKLRIERRTETPGYIVADPRSIAGVGETPLDALRDYEQAVEEFAAVEANLEQQGEVG